MQRKDTLLRYLAVVWFRAFKQSVLESAAAVKAIQGKA